MHDTTRAYGLLEGMTDAERARFDDVRRRPRDRPSVDGNAGSGGHSEGLTPRELEVLADLADGVPIADSATRRGISYWTVKDQLKKAYRKLGAHDAAHAVAIAFRRGLID